MKRRTIGIAALMAGVLTAAWLALSPYWAMSGLRSAADAGDAAAVNRYVDYETLRANLKQRVTAHVASEISRGGTNPMGGVMAQAFITPMIDQMVRPEIVAAALARRDVSRAAGRPDAQTMLVGRDPKIQRTSIDRFVLRGEGPSKGGAVFELQGFGWRMVDIEMENPMTTITRS